MHTAACEEPAAPEIATRPTILLGGETWAIDESADDLGLACIIEHGYFDVADLEERIRRCLAVAQPPRGLRARAHRSD